jgi:peptide/nickel transport system ATP-binding protein
MTAPLLDIRGLSVSIRGRRRTVQALSDVDLRVDHGEVVGLVGESGGGKTMIARTIVATLPRGARATGSVRVAGREVLALSGDELADHRGHGAAMCFQNPRRALAPVRTIGRQLTDRVAVHQGLRGDAARAEAVSLLRQVGLRDAVRRLDTFPHELSGGMSQRVMIATALACRPRLLLADEPTTGLDVTLTRDILELFRAIADEQDRGVLLVSHDIATIAEFCDRLVVLYAGSVVESGPTDPVLTHPAHPYTRTLLDAVPDLDGRVVRATPGSMPLLETVPTACPFTPRCSRADATCATVRPSLEAVTAGRAVSCFHPLDEWPARLVGTHGDAAAADNAESAVSVVRISDVRVRYPGRFGSPARDALQGVSLAVGRGETLGIVGESGCGKTTLARLIVGLLRPTSGSVEVGGIDVGEASGQARRRLHSTVQMVFQDPVGSLSPRRTARQAIAEPMTAAGVAKAEQLQRTTALMQRVGLDDSILERRPHELSGGQAQRVAIARALSVDPAVVVFDEPTSALDVTVQAQILDLIGELAAAGDRTYVFISHDLAIVRSMSDHVAVLYLGRVVEVGATSDVFAAPRHPYTRALLAGAPSLDRRRRAGDRSGAVRLARELDETPPGGGCALRPRCPFAAHVCADEPPLAEPPGTPGRLVACWRADEIAAGTADRVPIATTTAPP